MMAQKSKFFVLVVIISVFSIRFSLGVGSSNGNFVFGREERSQTEITLAAIEGLERYEKSLLPRKKMNLSEPDQDDILMQLSESQASLFALNVKLREQLKDSYGDTSDITQKIANNLSEIKSIGELMWEFGSGESYSEKEESADLLKKIRVGKANLLKRLGKERGLVDMALLGAFGPEAYKLIENMNIEGFWGTTQALVTFKGSGVLGKAVDEVFEKRISSLISHGLDQFGNGVSSITQFCYKKMTGRYGDPFSYDDIAVSKRAVGDMLSMLIEAGRKAANIGNRDKILRLDDEGEDSIDPLWLAMRTLMVNKFKTQVELLNYSLEYYKKDEKSRISLYAHQISDSLNVLVEHVLMPTSSYKDLGEGGYQNALQTLRKSIDSDYESLLKNLPSSSNEASSLGNDSSLKRPDNRDRDSDGLRQGFGFN